MKLLLVIDVDDDVAKNYKEFTVNYDLRGDYGEWDESVKYVEYCPLKPMPEKKEANRCEDKEFALLDGMYRCGWNACIEEIEK